MPKRPQGQKCPGAKPPHEVAVDADAPEMPLRSQSTKLQHPNIKDAPLSAYGRVYVIGGQGRSPSSHKPS
jgi:hypothetical protein